MDVLRILELAHDGALATWHHHKTQLEESPLNGIRQRREESSWKELKELEEIITAWKEGKCNGN